LGSFVIHDYWSKYRINSPKGWVDSNPILEPITIVYIMHQRAALVSSLVSVNARAMCAGYRDLVYVGDGSKGPNGVSSTTTSRMGAAFSSLARTGNITSRPYKRFTVSFTADSIAGPIWDFIARTVAFFTASSTVDSIIPCNRCRSFSERPQLPAIVKIKGKNVVWTYKHVFLVWINHDDQSNEMYTYKAMITLLYSTFKCFQTTRHLAIGPTVSKIR
jgi:hypothetical protein